jgi:Uma2 family endonuclease
MTVQEFLQWAEGQAGRYELIDGVPCAMSPERLGHARTKHRIARTLENAIAKAGLDCEMTPDGMTVKVHEFLSYEPDAMVYCGATLDDEAVTIPNPVIVVEVLSPGTKAVDFGGKLEGYFKIDSLEHYLIINPTSRAVIHHKRGTEELIETRVLSDGIVILDPPGMTLDIAEFFS